MEAGAPPRGGRGKVLWLVGIEIVLILVWTQGAGADSGESKALFPQDLEAGEKDVYLSHSCIHDEILHQRRRAGRKEYSVMPQVYQEPRQKADRALEQTVEWFRKALAVEPVKGNLRLSGYSACGQDGGVQLPHAYVEDGVANADLVLLVTTRPTTGNTLAWAVACERDQWGRAIAGHVNVAPRHLTAEAETLLSATLIHEVMHVLGFDPHAFTHFRDERKRRRDYSLLSMFFYPFLQVTVQTLDEKLGRMVTRVVLPRVVMHSRHHYGVSCIFPKLHWVGIGRWGRQGYLRLLLMESGSHVHNPVGLFSFQDSMCPKLCSFNGDCIDGTCHCFPGFHGRDCSKRSCPDKCSGHGICKANGVCECQSGWTGIDCSTAVCDEQCSLHGGVCDNGKCEFRCSDYAGYTCQKGSTILPSLSMCHDVLVRDSDGQHCAPSELSILQQLEAVVLVPNYNRLMPSGRTFLNFFNNANCAAAAKRLACWVLLSSSISVNIFILIFPVLLFSNILTSRFNGVTRMGTTGFGYATLHANYTILLVEQVWIAQTRPFLARGKKKRRVFRAQDMARRSLSGYNFSRASSLTALEEAQQLCKVCCNLLMTAQARLVTYIPRAFSSSSGTSWRSKYRLSIPEEKERANRSDPMAMSILDRPQHCTLSRVLALATVCLVVVVCTYSTSSPAGDAGKEQKYNIWRRRSSASLILAFAPDDLEVALRGAAYANRTLILTVLNEAYAEDDGLLDLFLQSLREGDGTAQLIDHVLFVAMDRQAFRRCRSLGGLRCYLLRQRDGAAADLSSEQLYMSDGFIRMMWRRIRFLGDVLKHGYSFIFTDMDVMWLRNPFPKLEIGNGEDLLISSDKFSGVPHDYVGNELNTGFFFAASNGRTVALFDEWHAARRASPGMKEQDVLNRMKRRGAFRRLGVRARVLDTARFSGFCQDSRDAAQVATVHANCCRTKRAKVADLRAVLRAARRLDRTAAELRWPAHSECVKSWA
ncbi:Uncharacterized protein BAE44_0000552 [Dichanthelium oligosanthes]|uniref:EGF-like domain-containing protein n=1 Tax=Dichanthelium oligosanthes TaxID=888268 RepID=A0A1E5WM30_9POAL|nr:Uncharacterized protein BAE44_0000552 [Dichanthelium oligosanthes]